MKSDTTTHVHFRINERSEAKALVLVHHYSKRWPSTISITGTWHLNGGLFGDCGDCVAACCFGSPPTRWTYPVLELMRLVRTPSFQGPLSQLISLTVKAVKRRRMADLLVSFADKTHHHHGGVYQAASWNYHGCRAPRMDGVMFGDTYVPGRTANALWGTQSPARLAAIAINVEAHYDEGKHLYWRTVTNCGKRQAKAMALEANPYVKPMELANGEPV